MPGAIFRLVAFTFVAVGLALAAGWGSERGRAESGASGAEGRPTFSGRDLPSFLKEPPTAMGILRLEQSWISSSVAQVWNHGDDVSELAAGWRARLRRAGFERAGRSDFEPANRRFTVVVEAIVFRDAPGAREGVAVFREVHSDYVRGNGMVPTPLPARKLGPYAWALASHSPDQQDRATAFGFRVGNVAFSVAQWASAPIKSAGIRAVALEIARRAKERD
jgi:hypothetical protein